MAYFDYIVSIGVVIVLGFTIITMYRQLFEIFRSNKGNTQKRKKKVNGNGRN